MGCIRSSDCRTALDELAARPPPPPPPGYGVAFRVGALPAPALLSGRVLRLRAVH